MSAEKALDSVKDKLLEQTTSLEQFRAEAEEVQDEYERLQQRHAKLVADLDTKERQWKGKYVYASCRCI